MARVKLPNAQYTTGVFFAGARITGVTFASSGLPATGYTTEAGGTTITYPLVANSEGGFTGWFAPGSYNIAYNAADDTVDNPQRWEAAVGVDTGDVSLLFEAPINVQADGLRRCGRTGRSTTPRHPGGHRRGGGWRRVSSFPPADTTSRDPRAQTPMSRCR